MKRSVSRALQGVALAIGAPLGWLLIQRLQGTSARVALTGHAGVYLYMLLGTVVVFGLFGLLLGDREARLLDSNRHLEALAITDPLTGLRNARYFQSRLAEEYAEAKRTGSPLALVVVDLDHFKRVNDRYGHPVGDDVLSNAARAIASCTRHGETEARVGGEEFALLLPNSTAAAAREAAERVRRAIEARETILADHPGETVRMTASAGIATTAELPDASTEELYKAADEALYRAKHEGRNRTVVATPAI